MGVPLIAAACAPAAQAPPLSDAPSPPALQTKRITAATKNAPSFLYYKLHPGPTAGAEELGDLLSSGLVVTDDHSTLRPQLGEAVPSLENGLWTVLPDGRMETTVRIRSGARWHDGAPLTAEDLAFTATLAQDRELAVFRHVGFDSVDAVEARAPDTVTVKWRRPYIEADALFSTRFALPLPRHLLEAPYLGKTPSPLTGEGGGGAERAADNKTAFLEIPYWTAEFIGAGPFKLKEYVRGSHAILLANDAYALGRPRIDQIDVRFILDDNTFIANLLAGAVDFTLGRGPSLEQALIVRDQWKDGRMEYRSLDSWLVLYPQFLNPSPSAVGNPAFRRALLHAINRQEMVESIQFRLVPVADGNISPNHPRYREIGPSIVRSEHDPRRAAQVLESLGFSRGPDALFRDAATQRLSLQIRASTVLDILPKATYSVADYWQRLGIEVETDIRSVQAAVSPEWTATFPAFALQRQTGSHRFLPNLRSSQARTPERSFQGLNIGRYMNPEMDALIDRYVTTIPIRERTEMIAQIVHRITDEAIWLTLFFDTEPALISNRLLNVGARGEDSNHAWNAYQWDVR